MTLRPSFVLLALLAGGLLAPGSAAAQDPCLPGLPIPGCEDEGPGPPGEPPTQPPPAPPPNAPECDVRAPRRTGSFVGLVAEHVFAGNAAYRRCALTQQADAGAQFLRQTFNWSHIERSRDQYTWGWHDDYVRAVASHRIRLMPIIFDPPSFRSGRPAGRTERGVYPPARYKDMGRFAAMLVRRYGPKGSFWQAHPNVPKVPIRDWQVWNEPNFPYYWLPSPNAAEYVRLQRTVARAIRKADRGANVLTAGIAPTKAPGSIPLNKYVKQMYRAGARGSFRTLAINAYARNAKELVKRLKGVRKIMRRNRDRKRRVAVTEIGWATGGPSSRWTVTPARQAKLIRQTFRAVRKNRKKLRLNALVYYSWQDAEPYPGYKDFWGLHTGLLDKDGNAKPGLAAFSAGSASLARR